MTPHALYHVEVFTDTPWMSSSSLLKERLPSVQAPSAATSTTAQKDEGVDVSELKVRKSLTCITGLQCINSVGQQIPKSRIIKRESETASS